MAVRGFMMVGLLLAGLAACDAAEKPPGADTSAVAPSGLPTAPIVVGGERFTIELAYEPEAIYRGLGGRASIDERGGMLFIFPEPAYRQFVMRDCLVPIDIAYLDGRGEILDAYTMAVEPPQREGETEAAYNNRLKRYPSRYRATFVLETAGGTWERLRGGAGGAGAAAGGRAR